MIFFSEAVVVSRLSVCKTGDGDPGQQGPIALRRFWEEGGFHRRVGGHTSPDVFPPLDTAAVSLAQYVLFNVLFLYGKNVKDDGRLVVQRGSWCRASWG